MKQTLRRSLYSLTLAISLAMGSMAGVQALGSQQNPQSGSNGLQGKISSPAPTTAATISLPVNGTTFTNTPITVSGLCLSGLLVKVFSNNIFVGSVLCTNGSFSLQASLFSGQNDLIARVYDALDQAGPDSATVRVTFQDAQFSAFGQRVSLTSRYAKLGADPGAQLTWPIILSGGSGPYAISVDWGDGTASDLKSVAFADEFTIMHVYQSAGTYRVIVKATDANGQTAYLQLVGVANGAVTQGSASGTSGGGSAQTIVRHEFVWWPFAVVVPLLFGSFWLGTKYELLSIHRQIERQTASYSRDL